MCLVEFSIGRNFATEIAKKGYARYKQTSLFLLSLALSLHRQKEKTNKKIYNYGKQQTSS